ncbi:MAG TPA: hypothetical protein VHO49_06225 [Anaerolineales bacterium]|nr:hypothetical protein [Anaerolineales bacterium]
MKRMLLLSLVLLLSAGCAIAPAGTPEAAPTTMPADLIAEPATTQEAKMNTPAIQIVRTIELPFIPHDIAVAADGSIYAVELGAPRVHKLDSDGKVLVSWGEAGTQAGQFAFDPLPDAPPLDGGFIVVGSDGNVYVTDSYNNRVQVFDSEGGFVEMWESFGQKSTRLQVFDSEGGIVEMWDGFRQENSRFNNPGPISIDARGNIYVADFQGGHVFDADGNYLETIRTAGELAFDSLGNMFTVIAFEGTALKVPAGGGEPSILGTAGSEAGQFTTPMWVEVGPDDTVYISDHSGRVQLFDADGNLLTIWTGPLDGGSPLAGPSPLSQDSEGNIYVATKDRKTVYVIKS